MNNKDFIKQLNNLKTIKADSAWKESNRNVLYSQISNTNTVVIRVSALRAMREFFSQPSFALFFVLAFIVLGSVFSVSAVNTKPGDSFYIAKVISERAQLAITFDEEKKAKLSVKFAHDRAKQIAELLAETRFSNNSNDQEKNNRLAEDFKKEINIVKVKISDIKSANNVTIKSNEDDAFVVSANLGRDDQGIQISDPDYVVPQIDQEVTPEVVQESVVITSAENTNISKKSELEGAEQILNEAEALFDCQDYAGSISKLEEVNNIINTENDYKTDSDATTTNDKIEN